MVVWFPTMKSSMHVREKTSRVVAHLMCSKKYILWMKCKNAHIKKWSVNGAIFIAQIHTKMNHMYLNLRYQPRLNCLHNMYISPHLLHVNLFPFCPFIKHMFNVMDQITDYFNICRGHKILWCVSSLQTQTHTGFLGWYWAWTTIIITWLSSVKVSFTWDN